MASESNGRSQGSLFPSNFRKISLSPSLSLCSRVGLQVQPLTLSTPAFRTPASFQETSHHGPTRWISNEENRSLQHCLLRHLTNYSSTLHLPGYPRPTQFSKENCTNAHTCRMLLEIVIIFDENLRPLKKKKKLFLVKNNDFNQEINLRNIFMVKIFFFNVYWRI